MSSLGRAPLGEPVRGDGSDWYAKARKYHEAAYLATDDPRGQSGFRGDEERWRLARVPIIEALSGDGTFLDIGCANGHLMETIVAWASERGLRIEPYGLDISSALIDLGRRRLPQWGDRFFEGNAADWSSRHRFDYVRTELVYVPDHERERFVRRLLSDLVAPGGRLIVCSYRSASRRDEAEPVGDILRSWSLPVLGEDSAREAGGAILTRVAWVEAI